MTKAQMLKSLLAEPGAIIAPGCYDGLSARLVHANGFKAAYMTGFGSSASILGKPDYGLLTMTEMVNHGRNLANSIDIPLIADADTGYGNPINVVRTVEEYETAGVAAIHIEDQVFPKRCGHMDGKTVIPMAEHVAKIRAAVDARKDMLIIARTDARAPLGLDEAIRRANAYHNAGADIIFVDAPQSMEELKIIPKEVKAPLLINMTEGGKTPIVPVSELEEMGYKIVIYPCLTVFAAHKSMNFVLEALKKEGSTDSVSSLLEDFGPYNQSLGLDDLQSLEKKYSLD